MSTSDSDSATENTPLMDTHVEETRSDAVVERSYRKKKRQNEPNSQAKRLSRTNEGGPSDQPDSIAHRSADGPGRQPVRSEEWIEDEEELKYGAKHVIKLFIPVSFCMLVVVSTMSTIHYYSQKDVFLVYTPFHEDSPNTGTKAWNAVANSLILMCFIIVLTVVLIMLYKHRCYMIIHVWLILSSFILLFFFSYLYAFVVLRAVNMPMDIISMVLLLWNFGVVGMICIHWRGPLCLQQAYLIFVAALMALFLIKYMPEWTTWVVLAVISIWDLVAVLTPKGPLRILVETAQKRNENIFPALIYSSTVMYTYVGVSMASRENSEVSSPQDAPVSPATHSAQGGGDAEGGFSADWAEAHPTRAQLRNSEIATNRTDAEDARAEQRAARAREEERRARRAPREGEEEERGVKLGLGDFIFYSVLVGKVSSYGDWNTTLACFVAILIGLCLTLGLLAIFQKALPALPISIMFGLLSYFATDHIAAPFVDNLAIKQVFI